jgi:hypothetical protein
MLVLLSSIGSRGDVQPLEALAEALRAALRPETARRAQALASRMELLGARKAAERLAKEFG